MSNSDIRVVPGPANYFSHPGSLERLSDFFNADQLSRAVWVYGERALAGAEPFLPAAFHLPEAKKIRFTGHCSERDVAGLVLVEPRIILNAPAEYLLAGIGDTLAKWYEAVVLAPQPEALPLTVRLGINGAQAIRDVLLASSETALADQRRGDLTQAFRDVVEAIIAGGGMVGGLGERYTRVAAAHAVHNGLTVLPQTDKFLHGTKVAYGILVQSALLGQDDVLAQLVQAYQHFNLPTTLAALEVDINNRAELDRVIAHTLRPGESIHYLPVTLTPEVLRAAFEKVEYFSR
ncbi:TPA: iron-containing alcohol dehydrogenase [Klebsiella pneumoniae]|nr:iron-containing alcohol dehydrogenase [Klebsiella pneumoniae]